jgi:Zn-dependent peptidase ImmA (M78 family)
LPKSRSASPISTAKEILQGLQIRDASEIRIKDIAMERGAFVRERALEGSEGRLIRKGNLGIITVNSRIPEEGRKRFAIAHELGHFELHSASQLVFCTEQDMLFWNESKTEELQANEFAAEILMPEGIFREYVKAGPPNMDKIKEVAKEFRTTLTATALRYVQLSKEPCALVISEKGVIGWYKKSPDFNFHVKVGGKLSFDTYAFDFYDGVELPTRPQKVPASSWIAGEIDDDSEIFEHSIALPRYNVVLSLLWIHEEVRRKDRRDYEGDEEPEFDLTNPFTADGKRWRW